MINKEKILSHTQLLIIILLFIYDLLSYIPETYSLAVIKVIYYSVITMLYLVVVVTQTSYGRVHYLKRNIVDRFIIFFIYAYLIRMIYDLYIKDIDQLLAANNFTLIYLFINAALLPYYALNSFDYKYINWHKFNKYVAFLVVGSIGYSLYMFFNGLLDEFILSDGRMMGNTMLDTIAFGHMGVTCFLLGLVFLQKNITINKLVGVALMLLGLFTVFGAGSRGPVVALVACLILYALAKRRYQLLLYLLLFFVLLVAFFPLLNDLFLSYDNTSLERLYDSLFHQENLGSDVTSQRTVLFDLALPLFYDNPILGYSFLLNGSYVHNFILESFLALGLLGGGIFFLFSIIIIFYSIKLIQINERYTFISLLYIQYFVYGMFSRSLSILPVFWFSLLLVFYLYKYHRLKSKLY